MPARRERRRRGSSRNSSRDTRRSVPREEEDDDLELEEDFDRSRIVTELTARYGDATAALNQVLGERYRESRKRRRLRQENNELREQLEELHSSLQLPEDFEPEEGALVLNKEQAAEWKAYRDLKLKVDDIKTGLQERDQLKSKTAERERGDLITKAAKDEGYGNPEILSELLTARGLVVEYRDVEGEDGKKQSRPFVRENKDGAEATRLSDYVEKKASAYKPALLAEGSEERRNPNGGGGNLYPRVSSTPADGKKDPVAVALGNRDWRPSKAKDNK